MVKLEDGCDSDRSSPSIVILDYPPTCLLKKETLLEVTAPIQSQPVQSEQDSLREKKRKHPDDEVEEDGRKAARRDDSYNLESVSRRVNQSSCLVECLF